MRRAPAEVLLGRADEVRAGIEGDFALLDAVEAGAAAASRAWAAHEEAVVLGVGLDAGREADVDACRGHAVAVLRRASGGGAVLLGPGTVQFAFALPHDFHPALASIEGTKRLCAGLLVEALARGGLDAAPARAPLSTDASGDVLLDDRKVVGVALARRRTATLLHGTLLAEADLGRIGLFLRHPSREPGYRRGRPHADFLANLGPVDPGALGSALEAALQGLPTARG